MTMQEISKRILRKQGFVKIREVVMDEGIEDISSFISTTPVICISDIKQCPAKFCEHKNVWSKFFVFLELLLPNRELLDTAKDF